VLLVNDAGVYGQTNGHATAGDSERYGTRCATGVIQRKRYDRVFSNDEEEDDDDDDDDAGHSRLVRSQRNRTVAGSDSDDGRQEKVHRTPTKSASSTILRSSSSTLQYSVESEGGSSDTETASNAASESSADSSSDTEAYSGGSGPVKTSRTTRSAAGGRPVIANGHVRNSSGLSGTKYRTRNQGRRTVHYEEADSDMDYDGRDERGRSFVTQRTELGSRARLCRS